MSLASLHRIAALTAMAFIASFWSSTVLAELLGEPATIARVKDGVLWAMPGLILAMAATGASGAKLAGGRSAGLVGAKQTRMKIIAANGVIVLVPSAFALARWAAAGDFGTGFVLVQGLELVAGATNFTLMALNFRDGRQMARRRDRVGADA